jgi:hypothetical protein
VLRDESEVSQRTEKYFRQASHHGPRQNNSTVAILHFYSE